MAAVANLTYLFATAGRPDGPDSGAIGPLAALLGLLLVVPTPALGLSGGADALISFRSPRARSSGRQRGTLPTAFISPGSRPGF